MYWVPKMHKNSACARFIIASKICSIDQISKLVSNVNVPKVTFFVKMLNSLQQVLCLTKF